MNNKIKFPLYITPDTMKMIEENMEATKAKSKTEYIEQAIRFYSRYIATEKNSDYYPEVITNTINESYGQLESRMATLLFKFAVEMNMMMRTVASTCDIDLSNLKKLRGESVNEVKSTHGKISFENMAYRYL